MSNYPQHAQVLAQQLIEVGRWCDLRNWVPATSSNFSQRIDANSLLVTASGQHKGMLTADSFLAVDIHGKAIEGGKPSAETLLHCQRYLADPATQAVLHTHSKAATVLSRASGTTLALADYELLKAFPRLNTHESQLTLPIFENDQDIARLSAAIMAWEAQQSADTPFYAYMIRGHGIYTWANSLEQCKIQLEALEFLLECELEHRRIS